MSTATLDVNNLPEGFKERKGTELFKWEKQGTQFRGTILNRKMVEIKDEASGAAKKVTAYSAVPANTTQPIKFLAPWDLADKLASAKLPGNFLIEYVRDETMPGQKNAMKKFRVFDAPGEIPKEVRELEITDDDIPF